MKKILFPFFGLLFLTGSFLNGAEKWLSPPDKRWMLKLEPALERAKKEKKFVYVMKTGSDWCSYCLTLEEKVLSQKRFSELAKKHLVMVYLDFPSAKVPMPKEQREYNNALREKLNFGQSYPEAKILDADGNEIFTVKGYSPEKLYISKLYTGLKLPDPPKFPSAAKLTFKSADGSADKTGFVEITAWGTSPDAVNRPFSAVEEIKIAPRQRIFFKLRYQLPKKFRANLIITGTDDSKILRAQGKKIDQSGTYIVSVVAAERSEMWWGIKVSAFPLDRNYTAATAINECAIGVTAQELSPEKNAARNKRVAEYNKLYRQSKFQIISWGYDEKAVNRPFDPQKTIRAKKGRQIYFKIRYQLPKKNSSIIWVKSPKGYSFSASGYEAQSGVITRFVSCLSPGKRDHLQVTLLPKGLEEFDNIVQIPCNIIWE
jgi:protein disulfide-isomerase